MELADALSDALENPPGVPATVEGLVRLAGGANSDLARLVAGLPAQGRLPADTGPRSPRRSYDNTMRSLQRYRKTSGETRGKTKPEQLSKWQRAVVPKAQQKFIRDIRRRGARVRLIAVEYIVSDAVDVSDAMPVAGPGVYIDAAACRAFTDPWLAGNEERAAGVFLVAFADAYHFPGLAEIDEIDEISMWLDGQPEP